jgi:hypothetical protein
MRNLKWAKIEEREEGPKVQRDKGPKRNYPSEKEGKD